MSKKSKAMDNEFTKINRTFSFAFKEGYEALEYLESVASNARGGKSAYIVNLLLEDKKRQKRKLAKEKKEREVE